MRCRSGSQSMVLRAPLVVGVTLLLAGCGSTDRGSADGFTTTGELIALSGGDAGPTYACIACHGIDGLGNGAGAPRLAHLDRGYLTAQMEAYASGRRRHPEMETIARKLTLAQHDAVSAYYATLPFAPSSAPIQQLGKTASLYHHGDEGRGLAPCASCHGARGEGGGGANPPLAGQPAAYLAEQMAQWRKSFRRSDGENVMLRISQALSPTESLALAAYASSLPGDPPRPESPAASRAAHHADPRNDALAPQPHVTE